MEPRTTQGVRVTDLERTVIDSIKDFEKIGGFEELMNCLSLVHYLDEVKLKTYLDAYRVQALYQRAGYLLDYFREEMQLSQEFIEHCKNQVGIGTATCWPAAPRYVRSGDCLSEDYSSLMNTLVISLVEHKSTQSSKLAWLGLWFFIDRYIDKYIGGNYNLITNIANTNDD